MSGTLSGVGSGASQQQFVQTFKPGENATRVQQDQQSAINAPSQDEVAINGVEQSDAQALNETLTAQASSTEGSDSGRGSIIDITV